VQQLHVGENCAKLLTVMPRH